jgi:Rrf2 family iron-sulfur cluster assembly transcriptional regulator
MALVDLASNSNGRPVALADISARQEISLSYLEQLFAKLRRSGLVKSVRGPGGGYLLARTAEDTRISDAILAVDEPIRATRCKPNSAAGCHSDKSRCLTHDLWEELSHQIQLFLSAVSLADVCNRRVLGKAMPVERVDGIASAADKQPTDKTVADQPAPDKPVTDNATVTSLKSPGLPTPGDPTTVAAE